MHLSTMIPELLFSKETEFKLYYQEGGVVFM